MFDGSTTATATIYRFACADAYRSGNATSYLATCHNAPRRKNKPQPTIAINAILTINTGIGIPGGAVKRRSIPHQTHEA